MTENKRYIYSDIGFDFKVLDSWFGYIGDEEPTEEEIEMGDYLVIGLASNQDAAEGICKRLNEQQDEINQYCNFSLHDVLDKKNKEIEQLKFEEDKVNKILDVLSNLEDLEQWKWEDLLEALDKVATIVGWETELLGDKYSGSFVDDIMQLEKEIEQLKSDNKELQREYDKQLCLYNGLGCEYDDLKAENKELKSSVRYWNDELEKIVNENEYLKKQLRIFEDALKDEIRQTNITMNDWHESIEEKRKLKLENEQLKKPIKQILFSINSLIDKSAPNCDKISVLLDLKEIMIKDFGEGILND